MEEGLNLSQERIHIDFVLAGGYDPLNGQVNNTLSGDVDLFQRTLSDISAALSSGGIDNAGVAASLAKKITNAMNAPNKQTRDNILRAFINEVNAQTGKHINTTAPALLIGDAIALLGLP